MKLSICKITGSTVNETALSLDSNISYIENIVRQMITGHEVLIQRCKHGVNVVCESRGQMLSGMRNDDSERHSPITSDR